MISYGKVSKKYFIYAVEVLIFLFLAMSLNIAEARNACKDVSKATFNAGKYSAKSDYWIDIANCSNLSTAKEINACKKKTKKRLKNDLEDNRDIYKTKLKLCGDLGSTPYNPSINPDDFADTIDNQYFPLTPGTTFTYEAQTDEGVENIVVVVMTDTKEVLGVSCVVVRDTATIDNKLVEDTYDWYAQDKDGNVWYFGEESKEYNNIGELVTLEGSWKAGRNGAQPGIIMKANPTVGDIYRQEYAAGEAEDIGKVIGLNKSATANGVTYDNCVQTKDYSPLEPDVVEHKYYAPGIGVVFEETVKGDAETVELIEVTTE